MKTRNLVLRIFTMIFSALMFVPMITNFVTGMQDVAKTTVSYGVKLADWTADFGKNGSLVTMSKVLYYILFAIAMALLVLEIVRLVLNKKNNLVEMFTKLCAILVLILSILVFVLTFIWCMTNIVKIGNMNPLVYLPWVGGVLTLVFGLFAGICGLRDFKEKSKK